MTRAFIVDILIWILYFGPKSYRDPGETGTWDPFLGRPDNFSGPKANFEIKTSWIAAKFQAHKPVNFASLTDSFIISFSKLLKLWSWMQTRHANTANIKQLFTNGPLLREVFFPVLRFSTLIKNQRFQIQIRSETRNTFRAKRFFFVSCVSETKINSCCYFVQMVIGNCWCCICLFSHFSDII